MAITDIKYISTETGSTEQSLSGNLDSKDSPIDVD